MPVQQALTDRLSEHASLQRSQLCYCRVAVHMLIYIWQLCGIIILWSLGWHSCTNNSSAGQPAYWDSHGCSLLPTIQLRSLDAICGP